MTKLTDTQLIILGKACERPDGAVYPVTTKLNGGALNKVLSSLIGNSCRHTPTCSEYGYESVARHGLWSGFWMTLFRFARCGPGGTWGFDPVPDCLDAGLHWYTPWRYWRVSKAERPA